MLDTNQTPARLVAEMRLVAITTDLPEAVADAFAEADASPEKFKALAPMLTRMLRRRGASGSIPFSRE